MLQPLNSLDFKILALLQNDARPTGSEIGKLVNKSTTPINNRIRALQESGVIKKYVAVLDHLLAKYII